MPQPTFLQLITTRTTRIPVLCFQQGKVQQEHRIYTVFPPDIHRMIRGPVLRLPVVVSNNQVRGFKVLQVSTRNGTLQRYLRETLLRVTLCHPMPYLDNRLERDLPAAVSTWVV
jgi:hypothetical protein